ncbi:hypothetical protein [Streptomyces sp. NPDC048002]|uniref:hypothetical protein n=1 Tax=Streptomyces sp. NPDC048002 TaxID=3154344 RepID=UPI0033CA7513
MISVPPIPALGAIPGWGILRADHRTYALDLRVTRGERAGALSLERCAAGRMRDVYPVARHDIEVRTGRMGAGALVCLLMAVRSALADADPRCLRLLYAVPADDLGRLAAAESAAFRRVVDVDLGGEEHCLTVWEPASVTRRDQGLHLIPEG